MSFTYFYLALSRHFCWQLHDAYVIFYKALVMLTSPQITHPVLSNKREIHVTNTTTVPLIAGKDTKSVSSHDE